jgi:6,7-dimethyl-8-ribityllumazine synthase
MKLGIVVSETYWEDITSKMLEQAIKTAKSEEVEVEIIKVPGSYDIPLPVKLLLKKNEIDGVVTLGAVVEGKTDHDAIISDAVAKSLIELSLEFEKPVVLGINGPKMTRQDGIDRIDRAQKVTSACIELINKLKEKV